MKPFRQSTALLSHPRGVWCLTAGRFRRTLTRPGSGSNRRIALCRRAPEPLGHRAGGGIMPRPTNRAAAALTAGSLAAFLAGLIAWRA